jgi:catechol 1,2-dioxygenase
MPNENPTSPVRVGQVPHDVDGQQKRTAEVVGTLLTRIWDTVAELDISYEEFDAAKGWLISVGEAGEWPLALDVFVEHAVEKMAASRSSASQSSIQGPFYVPDAPLLAWNATVPMRADEPGDRLVVRGRVLSTDGRPLAGAVIDHWQASADALYSYFCPPDADGNPLSPDGNLRARFETNDNGEFEIHTVVPAPYKIPHDGPTGQLLDRAGWHPWRPAHLHYFVDAEGHDRLTTQLFFAGDPWLGTDVASADKPDLVLEPTKAADGGLEVTYDFTLQPGGARRQGHSAEH